MKTLTVGQLREICQKYNYIILRHIDGNRVAHNCRIADLSCMKKAKDGTRTNYLGFWPCSFQEYITYKIPFIPQRKKSLTPSLTPNN